MFYNPDMPNNIQEKIDNLGHGLKLKFKLPPDRPTTAEVLAIVKEINNVPKSIRTDAVWREIVFKHVKFSGLYVYEGLDHSDLNSLQDQILLLLG